MIKIYLLEKQDFGYLKDLRDGMDYLIGFINYQMIMVMDN